MTRPRELPAFSVVLPVYCGDEPKHLDEAIESLFTQTIPPTEVIVIEDGELTEQLYSVLAHWEEKYTSIIHRTSNKSNRGLSRSLIRGVNEASNDLVARMDADDVCINNRFEKQLKYLTDHEDVDVVGGYIQEFSTDEYLEHSIRKVPTSHDEIHRMARFRNPMNHVTVLFRRDSVLKVGNYRPVDRMEDYDLWVRMLLNKAKFANLPEILVKVRGGSKMYTRRGGLEYAQEEIRMQREFYSWGFTNRRQFVRNVLLRTGIRLVPNSIRGTVYRTFARSAGRFEQ